MRRPTAAERARTMAYGVADAVLHTPSVPGARVAAHVTDEDGRPLLLMPAESGVVGALALQDALDGLPGILQVSDVTPVPLADRVRGRAWIHGWVTEVSEAERRSALSALARLHPWSRSYDLTARGRAGPGRTLLALEVSEVELEDGWGDATLEAGEYAAGIPDPFVAVEQPMITHLDACHRGELAAVLSDRLGDAVAGASVRALGLDRYGLWVRCCFPPGHIPAELSQDGAEESVDLRVAFPEPVSDLPGLRRAYRRLFATRIV